VTARHTLSRLLLGGIAALTVLALAGCEVGRPGAAALIGSERVPVGRVQDLARDLRAANPEISAQDAPRAVINRLIYSAVVADVAAGRGVQASDGAVDALLREFEGEFETRQQADQYLATQQFVPPSYRREWARDAVYQRELGRRLVPGNDRDQEVQRGRSEALNKLLEERARAIEVDINPRYGTWNPQQLVVAAPDGGGLSRPESPTPTARPGQPEQPQPEQPEQPQPEQPAPSPAP
jgi:parvulin-like peptidyl-prolyl isomerase